MKEYVKNGYYTSDIGRLLFSPIKHIYDLYRYRIMSDEMLIRRTFKTMHGYPLNLKDPKTLSEKIQWLKLYDRNPLHTICADKFAVREYIGRRIGNEYLIPLIYQTKNPKDIKPENLPDVPMIIKTNHWSGEVIIVRNKTAVDWKDVRKKLSKLLRKNYYHHTKEWQYKNIEPRIIVEELLLDENSSIPNDYKFHCMNGRLVFVQVDFDRQVEHRRNYYDANWNYLDCRKVYPNADVLEKPIMFDEMKSLAQIIASDFRYIRVDFYNLGNNIYFGELTFHTGSGYTPFEPISWEKRFGAELIL